METNNNASISQSPVAKKKWETPRIIHISTNEVQSGRASSFREGSFASTGSGYYVNPQFPSVKFINDPINFYAS
jgi:hypothetical protein